MKIGFSLYYSLFLSLQAFFMPLRHQQSSHRQQLLLLTKGQTAILTAIMPSGGVPPYSYQWTASTDNGTTYSVATSYCSTSSGSGLSCGATVTCTFLIYLIYHITCPKRNYNHYDNTCYNNRACWKYNYNSWG